PRRRTWEPRIEATSLTTLIQMVEGGLGVTLLPRITLDAGILKGTGLVARPFSSRAPSRTLALVARRTSPRRRDADLLAEFVLELRAQRLERALDLVDREVRLGGGIRAADREIAVRRRGPRHVHARAAPRRAGEACEAFPRRAAQTEQAAVRPALDRVGRRER